MDPVTGAALAELIANAVTSAAGWAWKQVRGTPEGRAVKAAIGAAVGQALRDSALPLGRAVDDAWAAEMDKAWRLAFTAEVSQQLVACVADPSGDAAHRFADTARQALAGSGCDLAELGRTMWMEEFLAVLPRQVFAALSEASLRNPAVRDLVDHVLRQRADARADGVGPATPGELRRDLITLLRVLDEQARVGRLPPYLPPGADVTALSRTVRVRLEVRAGPAGPPGGDDPGGSAGGGVYRLPVERPPDNQPPRPWPQVAREYRRLVVLADPGLGKSWLVRTETHRLCQEALAQLAEGPGPVVIPVPLRCDQLAAAAGPDLAGKAAGYLVAQGLLEERSRTRVTAMIRAGGAVMLLDALDELTEAETGLLRAMVRSWADQAGDRAQCVITSRIAGYTGPPLPGAREVELQAFTPDDAAAAIDAWRLPPAAAAQLQDRLHDPATGAMARIPLLLALMCSLAAQAPGREALPRTRGQLYERVLQWFLTGAHRSLDDPSAPARDNVEVEALLQILAPLAFAFATQPAGWTDLMPTDNLLNAIRAAGPAFTELNRPAKDVLRDLSVGAGVLVPDGDPSAGRSPRYLFLHRTVAEYLTARHLATLPEADWLAIVELHRWFDPDWAEVIPMLGERLSPDGARALIQHLLASQSDPFHYALLTAARVWGARPDADHLLAPRHADELVRLLDDLLQHELTSTAASLACAGMTYLPRPILTRLLAHLTDQERFVRQASVEALAGRQESAVTKALLGRLTDQDKTVRQAAVEALAGHQDPTVTEALLARLTDRNQSVRRAAVAPLAGRQDPRVTDALLARLTDQDKTVRRAAVEALGGCQDRGVTEALVGRLTDDDSTVRRGAVKALAHRLDPRVTEALLARLTDQDWTVRDAAWNALAGRQDPGVTEALLGLLTDQAETLRRAAAGVLAVRQDRGVTDALVGRLTDDDWTVRRGAVKALAHRLDPGVTEALVGRLTDHDISVRDAAWKAVAGRRDPGVTKPLLDRLNDHDMTVRRAAVAALAGRQDPIVTEALLRSLHDKDEALRLEAVAAVADRQDRGVIEALLRLLTDKDKTLQRAAVAALAGRQDPAVIEALLGRLTNQDLPLRREAMEALGRETPETLLILARKVRTLSQPSLLVVTEAAEALMIRHYRRIDPADQPEVLASMGWLTTAALSDGSA